MSKISTKDSEVYVGSPASKIDDLTDFTIDSNRSTIDCSTLSTEWAESLVGIASGSGSMTVLMDVGDSVLATLESAYDNGTELDFEWYPAGKSSGKPKKTFKAYLTSWNSGASVNSAVSVEIGFTVNGAVTSGTVSA